MDHVLNEMLNQVQPDNNGSQIVRKKFSGLTIQNLSSKNLFFFLNLTFL